ncbi:hypothetical protein [Oceanobacillus sojae]|uniref:hypothetical protein n=1 Tax=Oceanobacillus sojae TaxID=582851 RepID=UPI00098894CC|nr:hypothetical protein [Oceanobacillus sojae]
MIKRISVGLFGVTMSIILIGCSFQAVDKGVTKKYYKKEPLEINVQIPQNIVKEENTKLEIELSESGKALTDVDEISAEIWEKDSEKVLEPSV